jgi:hypothetical protein
MRYSQLLKNLSDAIDQGDSIPSTGVPSSGTATTVATGGLAFTLTQPFAFAHNTKTFTPTATLNWQNNWTISPVSDPQDLQNLRALAGLLYYRDQDIWDFVSNTLKVWNVNLSLEKEQREPPNKTKTSVSEDCGISPNPGKINDPTRAMEAYLDAWDAFPDYYSQVSLKVSFPALANHPAEVTIPAFGSGAAPPFVTINARTPASVTVPAFLSSETHPPCFVPRRLGGGITNAGLAESYGLLYPNKDQVSSWMRNGVSPTCREYQLPNILIDRDRPPSTPPQSFIFRRWLFWRDAGGHWKPYEPAVPPEYLGKYGNHDFWTTNRACLADFVVLTINATANSHAAAQNAPKQTGTTPASAGGP